MGIIVKKKPTFTKTQRWLEKKKRIRFERILKRYGAIGVDRLSKATPIDTSETANSWSFDVTVSGDNYRLVWSNSVMAGSTPLVILLHYGHGTGTGGYVPGSYFISSAIEDVLNNIHNEIVKEALK